MGHLGHLKAEYRDLLKRLDAGPVGLPEPRTERAREGMREILEILYTPEEAALAAKLPVLPSTLAAIARRTGVPEAELEARLDGMADKGLVLDYVSPRSQKKRYVLSPPVVGFFEFSLMRLHDSIPKKRMAEALEAYTHGDDTFAREVFGHETVVGRALVHESALADEPLPDVLAWERATALVQEARAISVSHCYCRHKAQHLGKACDAPMENCLSLGMGAEWVARRNFGRLIERSEALDILAKARAGGLVQIADNVVKRPVYICNCCGCCCGQLQGVNEYGLAAVNPSGFSPRHDDDRCAGCSKCARACPVGAIVMKPERVAAKRRNDLSPSFDLDRCIGCGVCVGACHKDALRMVRGGTKQRHVPATVVERVVRQTLEHGRLAALVNDGGTRMGNRFLAHVVRAITALPPAQRLIASEQLKSRFVKLLLGRVPDPTA